MFAETSPRAAVWLALLVGACGGPAFESGDEERYELQTAVEPDPGEVSSDDAIACGCDYLGSYQDRDYWACPVSATECLERASSD